MVLRGTVVASILLSFLSCSGGDAVELTPENWKTKAKGKRLFLKFYAPWCGHCRKLKPDWDKLAADFEGSPVALVGKVDCTGDGKPLCEKVGVSSYPTLMWGRGSVKKLTIYTGGRTYEEMKSFASDNLGKSCGPGDLHYCDQKRKTILKRFMSVPPEKLDAQVELADKQIAKAEHIFKYKEHNITMHIQAAERKRDELVRTINEQKGLPATEGGIELTSDNWDQHVTGKKIFVKFYAPWCGHCKSMKADWDRLMSDFEGTSTALVAEVDCTSDAGKDLCDKHSVTGFPRLLYGRPEKLKQYSGPRTYDSLKPFADENLGESCSATSLDRCEEGRRTIMQKLAELSPETRNEKVKSAEKAIEAAHSAYFDAQWNLTGQIDLAEQKKDEQIQAIKDQGLAEARQVQAWNKKQPKGFWKPPTTATTTPLPSFPEAFLKSELIEVSGVKVTGRHACLALAATLVLLLLKLCGFSRSDDGPKDPRSCQLQHILMEKEEDLLKAKERINAGEDFSEVAKECSTCPSGKSGGFLGRRHWGSMSPALNDVCFNPATKIGEPVGPVKSDFGFHLLLIEDRQGLPESAAESPAETRKDK